MEGMRFYPLLAVVAVIWLTEISLTGDTERCRLIQTPVKRRVKPERSLPAGRHL